MERMKPDLKTAQIALRIPADVLATIQEMAAADERSMSAMALKLLREAIGNRQKPLIPMPSHAKRASERQSGD